MGPCAVPAVTYADGGDIEFGLTTAVWASPPLDAGTVRVVRDGLRVAFDPHGLLRAAIEAATHTAAPVVRRSAKVILADPDDRVLLFRGQDPAAPRQGGFWFPPGGGLDGQEDRDEAARREMFEEVGLDLSGRDLGPVALRRAASFSFEGVRYLQEEAYFVVWVERRAVDPAGWTDQERRAISDHRWWPVRDLTAAVVVDGGGGPPPSRHRHAGVAGDPRLGPRTVGPGDLDEALRPRTAVA